MVVIPILSKQNNKGIVDDVLLFSDSEFNSTRHPHGDPLLSRTGSIRFDSSFLSRLVNHRFSSSKDISIIAFQLYKSRLVPLCDCLALDCSYELSKRPNSYLTEWLGTSGSRKLGMDGSSCSTFNFTEKTTRFHTTIGGLDSRSFGVAQHSQPLSNKMPGEKRDVRSRRRFRPEFWKCFCVGSGLRR